MSPAHPRKGARVTPQTADRLRTKRSIKRRVRRQLQDSGVDEFVAVHSQEERDVEIGVVDEETKDA